MTRKTIALLLLFTAWRLALPAAQRAENYVIGAQDVLSITLYEQPNASGKFTVEADGTFSFWQIGRIKAMGLTLREFEVELTRRLKAEYFRDPHVTVSVDQYRSQRVIVLGEVRSPGTYPLTGDMTLIEAIAAGGGVLPTASGDVRILHRSSARPGASDSDDDFDVKVVDIKDLQTASGSQIRLRNGDQILVPRAETIYVFGEVKSPGAYPVQQNTTVLQALSLAGGTTPNAALGRIKIVRVENGQKKEIKKVKVTDIVKPNDTIIVGERWF